MSRFAGYREPPLAPDDPRLPFQRATRYLSDEPLVYEDSIPMRAFLEEMSSLRDLVGERRTMVITVPGLTPGAVSFFAGLNPAPHFMAREMIMADMLPESMAWLKSHIDAYDCIITDDLDNAEARAFREHYPAARVVTRSLGSDPYYVVLR